VTTEHIELATGTLAVSIHQHDWPVADLLAFAARDNAKRGFLFVSKVLGKHWPVRPSTLRASHDALAAKLQIDERPTLFIGMAETAVGLGQGVFEAALRLGGQGFYLNTSRYPIGGGQTLHFEESHSHAPQVGLVWSKALAAFAEKAVRLVLIDDELSTGNTLVHLWQVLHGRLPKVEQIDVVCLTSFMGEANQAAFLSGMAMEGATRTAVHALLHGEYRFDWHPHFQASASVAQAAPHRWQPTLSQHLPRLGTEQALVLPDLIPAQSAPIQRVIGLAEVMHPAFVLGWALEQTGQDVYLQSVTRSPILLGAAIAHKHCYPDPYREGIPFYAYNLPPAPDEARYLIHENATSAVKTWGKALGATAVRI
jgi:hypothetical protein